MIVANRYVQTKASILFANTCTAGLGMALALAWGMALASAAPPTPDAVAKKFVAANDARTDLTPDQKMRLRAAVDKALQSPSDQRSALVAGLVTIEPGLQDALDSLGSENPAAGQATLQRLAEHRDPYVAATAADLLGRLLADQGRLLEALPLLTSATEEHADRIQTLEAALAARARVEASLLKRDESSATFRRLLRDFPNLPADTKTNIEQQLAELAMLEPGTLDDIHDRMGFSRRQLAQVDSGEPLRAEQRRIVEMLDELIERAMEKECKGQGKGQGKKPGSGSGKGAGSGKPGSGAGEGAGKGSDDPTKGPAVRKLTRGGPQSPWGQLRNRERDPAFSAIKEKVPARYQQLIEQYYRSFQEDRQ